MQLRYQYKTRDSVFHVFTEVPLSSHESKRSCICALELSILPPSSIFRLDFEKLF